jgi:hypothetical protein
MLEAIAKGKKKAAMNGRKRKRNVTTIAVVIPIVNRKFGLVTCWDY